MITSSHVNLKTFNIPFWIVELCSTTPPSTRIKNLEVFFTCTITLASGGDQNSEVKIQTFSETHLHGVIRNLVYSQPCAAISCAVQQNNA